jgi:hypothetical protein
LILYYSSTSWPNNRPIHLTVSFSTCESGTPAHGY